NAEHRVGQRLGHRALDLNDTVFFSHGLAVAGCRSVDLRGWMIGGDACHRDTPKKAQRTKDLCYRRPGHPANHPGVNAHPRSASRRAPMTEESMRSPSIVSVGVAMPPSALRGVSSVVSATKSM